MLAAHAVVEAHQKDAVVAVVDGDVDVVVVVVAVVVAAVVVRKMREKCESAKLWQTTMTTQWNGGRAMAIEDEY